MAERTQPTLFLIVPSLMQWDVGWSYPGMALIAMNSLLIIHSYPRGQRITFACRTNIDAEAHLLTMTLPVDHLLATKSNH